MKILFSQLHNPVYPLFFALFFVTACTDHAHNGEHDHGTNNHSPHGFINDKLNSLKDFFEHDDDHGHEHTERNYYDDHSIDDITLSVTDFTELTELFVEFPALVTAQESAFAAHLTRLDNFKPVTSGVVTLTLSGGGVPDEVFHVNTASVPGIFRIIVLPQYLVTRQISLRLQGERLDIIHSLGEYSVHPSQAVAREKRQAQEQPVDAISYLKEQQWQVDFALAQAIVGKARLSIQATGSLRPPADGESHLNAISTGHLRSKGKFPYPGMQVEAGQVLATITPRAGAGVDLAILKADFDKARSRYQLAKQERLRLAELWQVKAIAKSRLLKAESAEVVSKAELDATKHRYQQSSGAQQTGLGISIIAPISGVLSQVNVAPGQHVHEGDALFHIVNIERLWLETRIAEADIGLLQQPDGAWFTLKGFEGSFNTFELGGSLVALGGAIDPISRTVPLIFEFNNPDQRLRSGMFASVRVYTGNSANGIMVPASAIFNDGGQEVVYVMLDGESFQRRIVRLGIRDGDQVQLLSGVAAGEWVVSQGAYLVRLASAGSAEVGHGHAH